jgi:hypothetical protein
MTLFRASQDCHSAREVRKASGVYCILGAKNLVRALDSSHRRHFAQNKPEDFVLRMTVSICLYHEVLELLFQIVATSTLPGLTILSAWKQILKNPVRVHQCYNVIFRISIVS